MARLTKPLLPKFIMPVSPHIGEMALVALAVGGFTLALWLSFQATREQGVVDLRTPQVVLADALAGILFALGYVIRLRLLTRESFWWCLAFGLGAVAMFRLFPPFMNEDVIFYGNLGSADVMYVIVGVVVHGGMTFLTAHLYACRLVAAKILLLPGEDEQALHMSAGAVIVFFIIAAVMRLAIAFRP